MTLGRRVLLIVLTPLFPLLLFSLAFDYGVVRTVGDIHSVKHLLSESGIYNSVLPSLLKQNGQISTPIGTLPADDPLVQKAASKALPASEIQKNSELALDNIYLWLNGKIPQPTFSMNLTGNNQVFANNLASEVKQKLDTLPTCTTPYTMVSFDALNATCLPPGVNSAITSESLKAVLNNGGNFLGNVNLSAADFKGNDTSKSVFQDQLKSSPSIYQRAKGSPAVLAILSILVGVSLVFLRPNLKSGLRHIGATLLSVGIAMLLFAWVFNYLLGSKISPKISLDNKAIQSNVRSLVIDLGQKVDSNYWIFGGVYSILGIASISAPTLLNRTQQPDQIAETVSSAGSKSKQKPS